MIHVIIRGQKIALHGATGWRRPDYAKFASLPGFGGWRDRQGLEYAAVMAR